MSKKVSKNKKQLMDKRSQDVAKAKKELSYFCSMNEYCKSLAVNMRWLP